MSNQDDNLDRLSNALAAVKGAMLTIRQITVEGFPIYVTCEMTIEYLSEPKPTETKPK